MSRDAETKPLLAKDREGWLYAMPILGVLNLVAGVDAMLLPGSLLATQRDLGFTPESLGMLQLAQSCGFSVGILMWGCALTVWLPSHLVLGLCCGGWGLFTGMLACVSKDQLGLALSLRFGCGYSISGLLPVSQAIVARETTSGRLGRSFGILDLAFTWGKACSVLLIVPLSTERFMGWSGWRWTYVSVAAMSLSLAVVISTLFQIKEKRELPASNFVDYFKIPSFVLLTVADCFALVPHGAMTFSTMFFQLGGWTGFRAGLLTGVGFGVLGIGSVLGGLIGDRLEQWWPYHGRVLCAQVSTAISIPGVILVFRTDPSVLGLLSAGFVFFICGFWSHCGLKRPLLADLVAPSDQGRALAVNCVIDAFGFMAGASLAGYLAEERYNYPRTNLDAEPNDARASALGNAIVACSIAPSLLSFCSASALHWTVESDMRNAGKDRRVDDDGETQQL